MTPNQQVSIGKATADKAGARPDLDTYWEENGADSGHFLHKPNPQENLTLYVTSIDGVIRQEGETESNADIGIMPFHRHRQANLEPSEKGRNSTQDRPLVVAQLTQLARQSGRAASQPGAHPFETEIHPNSTAAQPRSSTEGLNHGLVVARTVQDT